MLVSQGLTLLLHHRSSDILFRLLPEDLIKNKIPITLFQILVRILELQTVETGCWGKNGSREETAYAILALANLASIHFVQLIRTQIDVAVARGRNYLISTSSAITQELAPKDFVWIGKVMYGIETICMSYVLSALHIPIPLYSLNSKVESILPVVPTEKVNKFAKLFKQLRIFNDYDEWQVKAYLIEGYLFLPGLLKVQLNVFDRQGLKEDSYFECIPFLWTASNNMKQAYASAQTIFDMMIISMTIFQANEFFDIILQKHGIDSLIHVRMSIDKIFDSLDNMSNKHYNEEILDHLSKFIHFVLKYPHIQTASKDDQTQLRRELKLYLIASAKQCEDNMRLQAQELSVTFDTPHFSFFGWVHSTGANHISSQYAFAFMTCLFGSVNDGGTDFFPTAEIKYIAQDWIKRLSVIYCISNDHTSMHRDRDEKNLSSTFFPEFRDNGGKTDAQLKQKLAYITQYERKLLQVSFNELRIIADQQLGEFRGKRLHEMVQLFYNVTEIYNQIYELKDINTRC